MPQCNQDPAAWLNEYLRRVSRVSATCAAITELRARVIGQHGAYGKRLDASIDRTRERNGGQLPSYGPLPRLGRARLDHTQAALERLEAALERIHEEIRTHRNACIACRDALGESMQLCEACGWHKLHVTDDEPRGALTWQRCAECRELGNEVPL